MSLNAHLFGVLFPSQSYVQQLYTEQGMYISAPLAGLEHWDIDIDGYFGYDDIFGIFLSDWNEIPPQSADNARLVALSDNQLVFLLSLIRKTEFPEAWYMAWGDTGTSTPAYPSQPLNGWAYGRVIAWLEDLKEQLMVDVRPELDAMVSAQNEMSDDLDAIRIALEQIAADIDAADNAEKLENIANMIGLLVTLL